MLQLFVSIKFSVYWDAIQRSSQKCANSMGSAMTRVQVFYVVALKDEISRTAVKNLMTELKLRQKITPLDMAYFYCYLASGVSFYEDDSKSYRKNLLKVVETSIVR